MAAKSNAVTSIVSSQELELDSSFNSSWSVASDLKDKKDGDFVVPLPRKTQSGTCAIDVVPSTSRIFTQNVTSALDRNKITNREAVRLIFPLAAAAGCNPASLPLSRSTIRRERKKARTDFYSNIKETFGPTYPLVIHWDGKILPHLTTNKNIKRLSILVSGNV